MRPDDIPPARGTNALIAACLLVVAIVFLLPGFGLIFYDGLATAFSQLSSIHAFALVGLALIAVAIRLLTIPQRAGAQVFFDEQGFVLRLRHFFRKTREHKLDWSEIEEMKLVEVPRGGDILAFRLSYNSAIARGLIQPTTREDAPRALVRREVRLPLKLCGVSINEAVDRFSASAEHAGADLVEQSSFNTVIYVRKVWRVVWKTTARPDNRA